MESGGHTHLLDVFDFETFEKAVLIIYTDDGTSEDNIISWYRLDITTYNYNVTFDWIKLD